MAAEGKPSYFTIVIYFFILSAYL